MLEKTEGAIKKRKPKGLSKRDNREKLAPLATQNEDKQIKTINIKPKG